MWILRLLEIGMGLTFLFVGRVYSVFWGDSVVVSGIDVGGRRFYLFFDYVVFFSFFIC